MDIYGLWSQAGDTLRIETGGRFWASIPKEDWPKDDNSLAKVWDEKWGDRRQELVFIGMDISEKEIFAKLDSCLLTDEEMLMEEKWKEFEDPIELDEEEEPHHHHDHHHDHHVHVHSENCSHDHMDEDSEKHTILLKNKRRTGVTTEEEETTSTVIEDSSEKKRKLEESSVLDPKKLKSE